MHRCVELEKGEACTPQLAYSVWSPFARYSNVNLIALAGESIVYRSICLLRRRHSCLEIIKKIIEKMHKTLLILLLIFKYFILN